MFNCPSILGTNTYVWSVVLGISLFLLSIYVLRPFLKNTAHFRRYILGITLIFVGGFVNMVDLLKDKCVYDPLVVRFPRLLGGILVRFNINDVLIVLGALFLGVVILNEDM